MHPEDLKYTKTHEWIKIEEQILTLGITEFAVKELGGINHVYVNEIVSGTAYKPGLELQPIDEKDFQDPSVKRGTKFLSGKTAVEIDASKDVVYVYSPVRGKVVEMNKRVNEENPNGICLIDRDPQGEGWLTKIEILDISSLIPLMTAKEYEDYLLEEESSKWESGDF